MPKDRSISKDIKSLKRYIASAKKAKTKRAFLKIVDGWIFLDEYYIERYITDSCYPNTIDRGTCCELHKLLCEVFEALEERGHKFDYLPSRPLDVMTSAWLTMFRREYVDK